MGRLHSTEKKVEGSTNWESGGPPARKHCQSQVLGALGLRGVA